MSRNSRNLTPAPAPAPATDPVPMTLTVKVGLWITGIGLTIWLLGTLLNGCATLLDNTPRAIEQRENYDKCIAAGRPDFECYGLIYGGRR
jgi:hypothetical protein